MKNAAAVPLSFPSIRSGRAACPPLEGISCQNKKPFAFLSGLGGKKYGEMWRGKTPLESAKISLS
ncbi:MAG: hypothetical protein L6302_10765 [Desulfobacteraceae bacterium]|nr:hypothetical protein [Desulfobacteraceae bacterium]